MIDRRYVAGIALSATALVSLVSYEGWSPVATPPVKGDTPTYGFGTTTHPDGSPVREGETITPPKALRRTLDDLQAKESAVKRCVKVPLYQHEYDAAILLSYNIGERAFCSSTVVKRFNAGDYAGACDAFLMWDKFQGKTLRGLTIRRENERRLCLGLEVG